LRMEIVYSAAMTAQLRTRPFSYFEDLLTKMLFSPISFVSRGVSIIRKEGRNGRGVVGGCVRKLFLCLSVRAQFHQRSTYSFYARRSQKRKKILTTWLTLTLLGTTRVKSSSKYVGEIDPRWCWKSI